MKNRYIIIRSNHLMFNLDFFFTDIKAFGFFFKQNVIKEKEMASFLGVCLKKHMLVFYLKNNQIISYQKRTIKSNTSRSSVQHQ